MGDAASILAVVGVGGSIAQGFFQKEAIQAQADAVASAAEYNAARALQEGQREGARRRRQARRELSSQDVACAKSGVRCDRDTPLLLRMNNAAELERDAVNAEIQARQTANLELTRASNVRKIGDFRAGAALLSGFTGAATRGAPLLLNRRSTTTPKTTRPGRGFGSIG